MRVQRSRIWQKTYSRSRFQGSKGTGSRIHNTAFTHDVIVKKYYTSAFTRVGSAPGMEAVSAEDILWGPTNRTCSCSELVDEPALSTTGRRRLKLRPDSSMSVACGRIPEDKIKSLK
jgi:hypothetical protein